MDAKLHIDKPSAEAVSGARHRTVKTLITTPRMVLNALDLFEQTVRESNETILRALLGTIASDADTAVSRIVSKGWPGGEQRGVVVSYHPKRTLKSLFREFHVRRVDRLAVWPILTIDETFDGIAMKGTVYLGSNGKVYIPVESKYRNGLGEPWSGLHSLDMILAGVSSCDLLETVMTVEAAEKVIRGINAIAT